MAVIITEFQLDQFSGGNPLRVLDLGSGLNVALVRDEIGSHRLLRVFPWFLYGSGDFFAGESADSAASTGGSGGTMILRTDHGVFRLQRRSDETAAGPVLTANDGTQYNADYLNELLDNLPAKTYREVFTFDLARVAGIVRGGSYGRTRLLRLATYLKHKSPQPTATAVPVPRADLSGLRARLGELQALLADSATRDDSPPDERGPRDREKLKRELKKLDQEIEKAQAKLRHLQSEIDETQCALAISGVQTRLDEINQELADARAAKAAKDPATGIREAAQRLDNQLKACRDELAGHKSEADDLRRQGKELGALGRIAQLVPQMEALLIQEKTLIKEEAAIEQQESQVLELEARLEAERIQVTTRPAQLASSSSGLDTHAAARVDSLTQRLREAEREQQVAEQRLARAESATHLAVEDMARASTLAAHPEDAVAIHEAEQRAAELRELLGLDEQLHRLQDERDDLEYQVRRLYAGQLMPFQMMMALGVPFMIGVAMIIYGLVMTEGETNWQLVILGFVAALVSAIIKLTMDRGTSDLLQTTRRRLSRVRYQVEQITEARESSAASGISLARQLEDAERHLEQLTSRFAAREPNATPDSSFGSVTIDTARMHLNESLRRYNDVKQQWRELMIELNLSPNLTPQTVREALAGRALHSQSQGDAHLDDTQSLQLQLQHLRHDLDRRRDWLSLLTGQTRQLIKELDYDSGSASVGEQMDILREALTDHKEKSQTRRQLSRALARIKQKIRQIKETGRRLAEQRRKLDDEQNLKAQQQKIQEKLRSDRVKSLERQRERLVRETNEIRNRYGIDAEALLAEVPAEELATRLENQTNRLERLMDRLMKKSEQRGRCRAQLNMPVDGGPRIAWEDILQKTERLTRECDIDTDLLDLEISDTAGRYEYLDVASKYIYQLTSGQFHYLECPRDDELTLVDHQGQALGLDQIRHEHYANIYFSLWLARLEAYADKGLRLPIVMEDPVEVADADSRPVVATLLRDFAARGHQVFLVTSKAESAELFSQLDVPIADLSERLARLAPATVVEPMTVSTAGAEEPTPSPDSPESAREIEHALPSGPLFPPLP